MSLTLVPQEKHSELSIRDKSNPRSLINIVPTSVAKYIEVLPESMLAMGETELKQKVRPDIWDNRLRIAFWNEYNLAQAGMRKMNLSNVYSGVCSLGFFNKVISNSFKLAYIITPPVDYQVQLEELLHRSLAQIGEIIDLPHIRQNGEPDAKMADVKYRITVDLLNRVRGQVIQRVEVKSQNLNVNAEVSAQGITQLPQDMDDINKRLLELEGKASGIDFGGLDVGKREETPEEILIEAEDLPK